MQGSHNPVLRQAQTLVALTGYLGSKPCVLEYALGENPSPCAYFLNQKIKNGDALLCKSVRNNEINQPNYKNLLFTLTAAIRNLVAGERQKLFS